MNRSGTNKFRLDIENNNVVKLYIGKTFIRIPLFYKIETGKMNFLSLS